MVWVNLLPWRVRRRQARLHRWSLVLLVLLAVLLTALLPVAGQRAVNGRRLVIVQRQHEGSQQINELKNRMAARGLLREQLVRQLAVRQQQQLRRVEWVDFALRLADQLPETLWLSELSKTPERLTLAGFCLTMTDVHNFRQRLQQISLFSQVTTGKISRSRDGLIQFSLQAVLNRTEDDRAVLPAGRAVKGEG